MKTRQNFKIKYFNCLVVPLTYLGADLLYYPQVAFTFSE